MIGIGIERVAERQKRAKRRSYWQTRKAGSGSKVVSLHKDQTPKTSNPAYGRSPLDAADQLRSVMEALFKSRPLLNKPERRLMAILEKALLEESPGWRAMGQVSLGEILWSDDKTAFHAINAKRVDMLIVDEDFMPLHAIEFQGTGHHLSNETAARDAVKKEALRRAGIGYVEVVSGDTPAQVRETVKRLVSRAA